MRDQLEMCCVQSQFLSILKFKKFLDFGGAPEVFGADACQLYKRVFQDGEKYALNNCAEKQLVGKNFSSHAVPWG